MELFYPNKDYTVVEEYIGYDFSSFVSDFGGYLGLLLGHSILTFYDFGWEITKKVIKKT